MRTYSLKGTVGSFAKFTSFVVIAMLVSFCGSSKSTDSTSGGGSTTATAGGSSSSTLPMVATSVPADSTGTYAALNLNFGSVPAGAALALATGVSSSVDLGNGVLVSVAKVNVGSIKVKADKVEDDSEKALKEQEQEDESASETEDESDKTAYEQQKQDLQDSYKARIDAATTQADKDTLESELESKKAALEETRALAKKAVEDSEAEAEAQADGNLKWRGPYVYDIVSGVVAPELTPAQVYDGSYRRIEFKVRPNRDLAGTDQLLNHSIYIEGTVLINSVATSFVFTFSGNEEFKLMGAGAIKVDQTATNAMTIAFDMPSWFSGVDLTTGTVGPDGKILIDDSNNKALWKQIKENIKSSTRFGKDQDGDGKLGTSEEAGDGMEAAAEAASGITTQQ